MNQFLKIEAHSNIALVKYWGKKGNQLPMNPSISFTLKNAVTSIEATIEESSHSEFLYRFEGISTPKFAEKSETAWKLYSSILPQLQKLKITIDSYNNFPHSAGIASSASSQAALALLAVSIATQKNIQDFSQEDKYLASDLARQSSGSASRSIEPGVILWGETSQIQNSSDLHAVKLNRINSIFSDYQDTILVVSKSPKKLSSSYGHGLMKNHPYRHARIEDANKNIAELLDALKSGDIEKFNRIVELEALSLHAMMMTSSQPFFLFEPSTIEIIKLIKLFIQESKLPVTYTLDAGPNIHLLYPSSIKDKIDPFIKHELSPFLESDCGVLYDEIWWE